MTTTFIFAGGGTGGHLYPGLAIAEQLRARLGEGASSLFLCSDREIDRRVLTGEGAAFVPLPARPFGVKPGTLWRCFRAWKPSQRLAAAEIMKARATGGVHVILMGGFVAAPVVTVAKKLGVPMTMVNIDAAPGKANRLIARRIGGGGASPVFTTVACDAYPHWTLIPPIVRAAAMNTRSKRECRLELSLDPDKPVLMITGGSLGATSLNRLMEALARDRTSAFTSHQWQVIHQCGGDEGEETRLRNLYRDRGISARVVAFTKQMGLWWGAADLALSRAGAGSVAEAWCNRVPTVFFPYPYHKDQHQKLNALELVRRGSAAVVTDHVDPLRNMPEGGELIVRLLTDTEALAGLSRAATQLPPADGASRIAEKLASGCR